LNQASSSSNGLGQRDPELVKEISLQGFLFWLPEYMTSETRKLEEEPWNAEASGEFLLNVQNEG
jgi:hypothetical protein